MEPAAPAGLVRSRLVGFTHEARARARRRGAQRLLAGAVAGLIAVLGLAWLGVDAGRLTGGAAGSAGSAAEPGAGSAAGLATGGDAERAEPRGVAVVGAEQSAPRPAAPALRSRRRAALASTGAAGRVTVVADGASRQVAAAGGTVAALLDRAGVELTADDRVAPELDAPVPAGGRVVVERVEVGVVEREVPIAHGEREEPAPRLPAGERRTVREGRAGLVVVTEEVTRVDGEAVAREEIARATVREPRDAVVEVGVDPEPAHAHDEPTREAAAHEPHDHAHEPHDHEPDHQPAGRGDPRDPATWDRLAECETGGDWQADSGNGYYGGLQFDPETWRRVGGTGMPHEHPRETQIEMGRRLHAREGWAPWPECARRLGYRASG